MTLRPLNYCEDCGYKWYPRGKDVSRKCPSCSGSDISITRSGDSLTSLPEPVLILLVLIGIAVFVKFAPLILMVAGGALGLKTGEILTGQSLERFADRSDGKGFRRLGFTAFLSVVLAIFGLLGGNHITNSTMSDKSDSQIQRRPTQKKTDNPSSTKGSNSNSVANTSLLKNPKVNTPSNEQDQKGKAQVTNPTTNELPIARDYANNNQEAQAAPPVFLGVEMTGNTQGQRYMTNLSYFEVNGKVVDAYIGTRIGDSGYTVVKMDRGPLPWKEPGDPDYFSGHIWIENEKTQDIIKFDLKPYN